jgi:hypothetical protein
MKTVRILGSMVAAVCMAVPVSCSSGQSTNSGSAGAGAIASTQVGGASSNGQVGGANSNAGTAGAVANGFVTTLSGSLELGDLGTAQTLQLCRDYYTYVISQITVQKMIASDCSVQAFVMAGLGATNASQSCHTSYDQCVTAAGAFDPISACNYDPAPSGCSATVSQYVTCTQDQVAARKPYLDQMGPQLCDQLDAGLPAIPEPPSCKPIFHGCSATLPGANV